MEPSGIRIKQILQYILPSAVVTGLFITFLAFYILPEIDLHGDIRFNTYLLISFSVAMSILLILVLFYLVRHAILSENLKKVCNEELLNSKEKYEALLETSPEGIVMIVDNSPVYSNMIFQAMTGFTEQEVLESEYKDLFSDKPASKYSLAELNQMLDKSGKTINFEAKVNCKDNSTREVVILVSNISCLDKEGLLFITRDISSKEKIGIAEDSLSGELQTSLLLMNLPVSSFMKETVTCNMNQSIVEAGKLMNRSNQDAILVTQDNGKPAGIVTDSDLRKRVVAGEHAVESPVFEVMSSPLVTIPEQSLLFEASLLIEEKKVSHFPVINKNGDIIGIFSKKDLHEIQRNSISYLIKEIRNAKTVDALKEIHKKVPGLVKTLMESGAKIHNITNLTSTITDAITERVIEYAIEEMGQPPVKFAFLALGSEGRREQTLVTDQDNAILFENVGNERISEVNKYFLYLGKKVNLWLDRIGYNYCQGEIMAGNPQWCQPLDKWKHYFSRWIDEKSNDTSLGISIFFDFRVVYGEKSFADELRNHVNQSTGHQPKFFRLLAEETAKYKLPVNIFKGGQSDQSGTPIETMNVKNGIMPITDFARIYSLYHRIEETNTVSRLLNLYQRGELSKPEFNEINHSYSFLMEIRFRNQIAARLNNEAPKNIVTSNDLTEIEKSMIRKIFSRIIPLQAKLVNDLKWNY